MTDEQAKEVLSCNTNVGYGIVIENESTQVVEKALQRAFKALEQTTKEDLVVDCVSRKAVLDTLMKYEKPCDDRQDFYLDSTTEFEEEIKEMQLVTPTRKVGKWVYDKASQNWRCSVCNETPKTLGYVGTSDFMEKEFVFCNHCGAEMVGAEG